MSNDRDQSINPSERRERGVFAPAPTRSLLRAGLDNREYAQRRERVLKALAGSAAVVLSGEASGHGPFKADPHFVYLTGITSEPGAAVLFNPQSEDPRRRIVLFLKAMNPELDRWDQYREAISLALKNELGFETIMRMESFGNLMTYAARRCKKLACLHGFSSTSGGVSADLTLYRKASERVVGCGIEDRTMMLPEMRSVKSSAEIKLMKAAAEATASGYSAALKLLAPGVSEKAIERAMTSAYLDGGAEGHAYEPIVGSGMNATVLHYRDNAAPCQGDELLLIDSGASFAGYACDVTRTYPVSGKFSPAQRELYGIVLKAQLAAIRAVKPGAFMWQLDKAARDVIEAAGFGDAYIHGIGHHLGMEVHDATPDGPLKAGMVITIEPGIYLPGGIPNATTEADRLPVGIRIEDDVLVTAKGCENLTQAIAKTADDIEKLMRRTAGPALSARKR